MARVAKNALAHVVFGRVNRPQSKHEDAIAALESAVDRNPKLAEAYYGLGHTLTYSGRPDEALPRFDTAIRSSPHDRRWLEIAFRFLHVGASVSLRTRPFVPEAIIIDGYLQHEMPRTSVRFAISRTSSTSMPRYLTVLSNFL